ncbi:MAG: prolipoprotein diacylglyceryl transferase [Planctomycetia bacterium]|jgi:phosphatidylglycerol:prolipoprotein diacylglycerol transferase
MRQELFHIREKIAGIPVFGVGWLLGIIIIAALVVMTIVIIRLKKNPSEDTSLGKELLGHIPFWFFLAAIVVWVLPLIIKEGEGLPIRGYGVMLLIAVVLATLLSIWRGLKIGMSVDQVISLVFWMFVPGIIGARLFFVIEYWHDFQRETFGATLAEVMKFTEGGLVVYGSVLGGLLGIVIFTLRNRIRFLTIADMLTPSLMLGIAIGRIGCLLNGCCFGGPCDHAWAVTFPEKSLPYMSQIERGQFLGVRFAADPKSPPILQKVKPDTPAYKAGLRDGDEITSIDNLPIQNNGELHEALLMAHALDTGEALTVQKKDGSTILLPVVPLPERSLPVHPTQIYSSLNAFVLFLFLLALSPFMKYEGTLFATLMTLYPITRFLLEIIRTDESAIFGTGLSISQNVSILLLLGTVGLWLYVLIRRRPVASL